VTGAGEREPSAGSRPCRNCGRELAAPAEIGWECECGIVICTEADCFDEFFKTVAGGEGTRCRTCGLVT
jgi:hypothetical protein